MMIIDQARAFAKKKHNGQTYNGRAYYNHPVDVYHIIKMLLPIDYELQAAALLHDTLETKNTTLAELSEEFGSEVASLVYEVTKTGYNTFPNLKSRRGVILKFADRLANLVNMNIKELEWQEVYIKKSQFWKI